MDLRERRRIETTQHIREAALRLVRESHFDTVTIEAICEAAGISQRTFFNYFPFKEAVFVMPPPPLPPEAAERFLAGEGELMADLIELMVAQAAELKADARWVGPLMREISEAHPRLMPLQMAEFQKFEVELTRLVATRLDAAGDDIRPAALAGAIIGAGRSVIDRWHSDEAADLPRLMRESLEALVRTIRG